jgi:hypothetical protein
MVASATSLRSSPGAYLVRKCMPLCANASLSRAPDTAKIKERMIYASSKDTLRRSLDGIAVEIQGTDADEVAWETGKYSVCSNTRSLTSWP